MEGKKKEMGGRSEEEREERSISSRERIDRLYERAGLNMIQPMEEAEKGKELDLITIMVVRNFVESIWRRKKRESEGKGEIFRNNPDGDPGNGSCSATNHCQVRTGRNLTGNKEQVEIDKKPGKRCFDSHQELGMAAKRSKMVEKRKRIELEEVGLKSYQENKAKTLKIIEKRRGFASEEVGSESCPENKRKKLKKAEKTKRIDFAKVGLDPPPPLSEYWKGVIQSKGGTDPKLVIMKQLFATDLRKGHGRLSIPEKQVQDRTFLTDEEENIVSKEGNINVLVIEPSGTESYISFRKWNMKKTSVYVLNSTWNGVFKKKENQELLKVNTIVQLWSFRIEGKLCLLLINVGNGDGDAAAAVAGCSDSDSASGGSDTDSASAAAACQDGATSNHIEEEEEEEEEEEKI